MSALAYLVSTVTAASARRARLAVWPDAERHTSTTQSLLRLLDCNGPMTTRELCDAAGLPHTKLVWGLLKAARACGQVQHDGVMWSLDRDFPGVDVLRAAELLRAHGWRLQGPDE